MVGGTITVYVNKYYEVRGDTIIKYHYHGGILVVVKEGDTLRYVHQDHLGRSSVATDGTITMEAS